MGDDGGEMGGGEGESMRDAGKTFDHLLIVVLLGMGRRGEGGMEVGEREIIHLSLHCHTTRMIPALRWAAMRAILMFS